MIERHATEAAATMPLAAVPSSFNALVAPDFEAWMRLGLSLVEAASANPVTIQQAAADSFRHRLAESAAPLRERPGASEVLIAAGALSQAIQHYNRQVQGEFDARQTGMRALLKSALEHLESTNAEKARILEEVRTQADSADADVLAALLDKLRACLNGVAQETLAQQKRTDEIVTTLRQRIATFERGNGAGAGKSAAAPARTVDASTGLPTRADAEATLLRTMTEAESTGVYIASFYIRRMNLINARFGEAIGNQVILYCSQHIATQLVRPGDLLFRWTGPAFVAILKREDSARAVATEVQRVGAASLSSFFETSNRSVYLPMRLVGESIPAAEHSAAEVLTQIEEFVLKSSRTMD